MNMEKRVAELENKVGINDEPAPLILINVTDCSKDSQDAGSPTFAVIPGQIGGPCGTTLIRHENEDPDKFLNRAESEHQDFYS
jgi:hypothetical protein